jgi:signal transduction histidine kinase
MNRPADGTRGRVELFIRGRWVILAVIALLAAGEFLFGALSPANAAAAFLALLAVTFVDQLVRQNFSRLEQSLAEAKKPNCGQLEQSLAEAQSALKTAEDSRRAMLNGMNDLKRSKDELEARVLQRTLELEKANAFLETSVAARTTTLENSRKAILHMMRDLKDDLTKLQVVDKMKTEFLSMVSHELRTPLTPIKGCLSLLSDGKLGTLSPQQKSTIAIMVRQSDHLLSLIDSILDISWIELGKPFPLAKTPIFLKSLIEETVETMRFQLPEQQRLSLDIAADLPVIEGDTIKIQRVLTNLIGNAIKFTPADGEIMIRSFPDGNALRTEVIDKGLGLEPKNLDKIFEKFYQVDSSISRAAGGMGLGLSIARELVELHGGKLWAESPGLGKGSKFIFTLPIG